MSTAEIRKAETLMDIAYSDASPVESEGNMLDIYLPEIPVGKRVPLIILHNGSGWMLTNGRVLAEKIADRFLAQGYAVAGVATRTSFHAPFPAQLHDMRAAVRWLRSNAEYYQFDADRFALMGQSSGGWMAAIVATTSSIMQLEGEPDVGGVSSAVQASIPFFPPTDFLKMDAWYADNPDVPPVMPHDAPFEPLSLAEPPPMGAASPESLLIGAIDAGGNLLGIQSCPEKTELANPIKYVDGNEPPILIMHGEADSFVPNGQSHLLFEALQSAGSRVEFISVAGAGHKMSESDEGPEGVDLGNPVIGGNEFTVYPAPTASSSVKPAPTWEYIDDFIVQSLS